MPGRMSGSARAPGVCQEAHAQEKRTLITEAEKYTEILQSSVRPVIKAQSLAGIYIRAGQIAGAATRKCYSTV